MNYIDTIIVAALKASNKNISAVAKRFKLNETQVSEVLERYKDLVESKE